MKIRYCLLRRVLCILASRNSVRLAVDSCYQQMENFQSRITSTLALPSRCKSQGKVTGSLGSLCPISHILSSGRESIQCLLLARMISYGQKSVLSHLAITSTAPFWMGGSRKRMVRGIETHDWQYVSDTLSHISSSVGWHMVEEAGSHWAGSVAEGDRSGLLGNKVSVCNPKERARPL